MIDKFLQLECMECKEKLPNNLKNNKSKLQITCLKCGKINNLIGVGSKDNLIKLRVVSIDNEK